MEKSPIIVVGVARSATTWLAHTIASMLDTSFVDEPDGHAKHPRGLVAKVGRGIFPVADNFDGALAAYWEDLTAPDRQPREHPSISHRVALQLWRRMSGEVKDQAVSTHTAARILGPGLAPILGAVPVPGPRTTPNRLVIKSVHACLYAHRLPEVVGQAQLVATKRPLIETAASWLRLQYLPFDARRISDISNACNDVGVEPPPWPTDPVDQIVWTVGVQNEVLGQSARRLNWPVFDHGAATANPAVEFHRVFGQIGVEDVGDLAEVLSTSKGDGSTYEPRRRAETVSDWEASLDDTTARQLRRAVEDFEERVAVAPLSAPTWSAATPASP